MLFNYEFKKEILLFSLTNAPVNTCALQQIYIVFVIPTSEFSF